MYLSSLKSIELALAVLLSHAPIMALAAEGAEYETHSPEFSSILGSKPKLTLLHEEKTDALFHEAAVYYPPSKSLFVTSNQLNTTKPSPQTDNKQIVISRISGLESKDTIKIERVKAPGIPLANGGVRYLPGPSSSSSSSGNYNSGHHQATKDYLIFCAQGNLLPDSPSGLIRMLAHSPYTTSPLLTTFHSKPFNSPNDVVVSSTDSSIWFTDPSYGYAQGVRPAPALPNAVYRFDPHTRSVRAVAAHPFVRPNGLAFGPGERVLYITDTGSVLGNGTVDPQGPASIYAFDVMRGGNGRKGSSFLANRRLFANATDGVPDGIKVDTRGNVYAGVGDGVAVWNEDGELIGKIAVDGGVANFGFGGDGVLFLLNEKRLWRADVSRRVKSAAL